MTTLDRGYTVLLTQLHSERPAIALQSLQAALSHHLAQLQPLPTPLAATVVSSPLYLSQPFTHEKLESLSTAFRHAVHFKLQLREKRAETRSAISSVFTRSTQAALAQWVVDVVRGLQGGQPVIRLACLTGLLLGIEDVQKIKHGNEEIFDVARGRASVENELVIAVAEIVDSYGIEPKSEWEREFRPAHVESETLCLSMILASQCLPLVSRTRLKALPLSDINGILVTTIKQAFHSGMFISPLLGLPTSASSTMSPLHIPPEAVVNLKALTSSLAYAAIAPLSKLSALTLELLLDSRSQKIQRAVETTFATLSTFRHLAKSIESDWNASPLPGRSVEDIDVKSREITQDLWSILKTFLFSTVMISQAALSTVVYVPPDLFMPSARPRHLALEVLESLYHLSFVISQFGGVSTDSDSFSELKRATYLALDFLTQGASEAELFAKSLCTPFGIVDGGETLNHRVQQEKKAFALACLEQLVPVLSVKRVRDWVWEMAYPHLSDPSHREIYESAHSVVLAMLASHASAENPDVDEQERDTNSPSAEFSDDFITRIIPFYAQCLIENSGNHKLSTAQLQLAYSALVRSAAASGGTNARSSVTLAWYCIDTLLVAIHGVGGVEGEGKGKGKEKQTESTGHDLESHLHRLRLAVIATVPSLPLSLMIPVLNKIRDEVLLKSPQGESDGNVKEIKRGDISQAQKVEVVNALHKEILEKVGDREKEAAMRWWYANLEHLDPDGGTTSPDNTAAAGLDGDEERSRTAAPPSETR